MDVVVVVDVDDEVDLEDDIDDDDVYKRTMTLMPTVMMI